MNISKDAEKEFNKIQGPFTIKTLSKLEIQGNFFKLIKSIYKNINSQFVLLKYRKLSF
jgi:hypothetical protein